MSDWYDPVIGGFRQNDIDRGRIYWIAPRGHRYSAPQYEFDTAEGAVQALRSPNYCARYLAWTRLHDIGIEAEKPLEPLLSDPDPRIRARAFWLLGQIPDQQAMYIEQAITDKDANVRIVGLRISELVGHDTVEVVQQLADDPSVRVRAECAVQLRHYDSADAARAWARLAAGHDGKDRWYLEALGIGAGGKWDACLAAYDALANKATAAAERDLIWRSRGTKTPEALARIVLAAPRDEDVRRYIRAFDFQAGQRKDDALLSVALGRDVDDEIALAALQRVSAARLGTDDQRQRLVELLASTDQAGTTPVGLIKQHRITELYPTLLHLAQQQSNDARVDAISALLDLQQHDLIRGALLGADPTAAQATGSVLAQSQHPAAMPLLLPFIQNDKLDAPARKLAARTLGKSDAGADQLIQLVETNKLGDELRQAIAGVLLTHRNEGLRRRAEQQFPLLPARNARPLPKLVDLIGMQGDATSGREVFFKQGKCADCHRVKEDGKAIGPDLSQIGTKLARQALFEAILYPSAAISHNYESYSVVLENGRTTTGVLVSQDAQEIQLRDAEGNLGTFDRSQVETFQRLSVSLMPANLHQSLTTEELVNLVDYLSLLKIDPGGPNSK